MVLRNNVFSSLFFLFFLFFCFVFVVTVKVLDSIRHFDCWFSAGVVV